MTLHAIAALLLAFATPLYDSPPPGHILTLQNAYLAGRGNAPWRAILSVENGWHLSLYVLRGSQYRLKYRSPGNGGPLWRGAPPMRQFAIVGTAQLLQPGTDELLVEHRMDSADCGTPVLNAIGVSASGRVVPVVTVFNGCDLRATVVRGAAGALDTLRLTGPYYGPNSGTCCPTKAKTTATLSYRNGSWTLSPRYFELAIDSYGP